MSTADARITNPGTVFSRHSCLLATIWVSFITTCYIINLSRQEQVCLMSMFNKYACLPMVVNPVFKCFQVAFILSIIATRSTTAVDLRYLKVKKKDISLTKNYSITISIPEISSIHKFIL